MIFEILKWTFSFQEDFYIKHKDLSIKIDTPP